MKLYQQIVIITVFLQSTLCAQYGGYAQYQDSACAQWNQNYYFKLDTCMLINSAYYKYTCNGSGFVSYSCGADSTCTSCSQSTLNTSCIGSTKSLCPAVEGIPEPLSNAVVTTTCFNSTICELDPDTINQKSTIGCFPASELLARYSCSEDGTTVTYYTCGYPQCTGCYPSWNLTMGCSNHGLITNWYSGYWQNLSCAIVGPFVSPSPALGSPTSSPSRSPTPGASSAASVSPTPTPVSPSPTPSATPTPDPNVSPSASKSPSPSASISPSPSPSVSITPTSTESPTPFPPGSSPIGDGTSSSKAGTIAMAVLIPVGAASLIGGGAYLIWRRKHKVTHTLLGE